MVKIKHQKIYTCLFLSLFLLKLLFVCVEGHCVKRVKS